MEDLTEEECERAFERAQDIMCPECGRADWLASYRLTDGRIVMNCDECMSRSIAVAP